MQKRTFNVLLPVVRLFGYDEEIGEMDVKRPFRGVMNPFNNQRILLGALVMLIAKDKTIYPFLSHYDDALEIPEMDSLIKEFGFSYVSKTFDSLVNMNVKDIIKLYLEAYEVEMEDNNRLGFKDFELDFEVFGWVSYQITKPTIFDLNTYYDYPYDMYEIEDCLEPNLLKGLENEAVLSFEVFMAEYEEKHMYEAKEKGRAVFVRWLGAFNEKSSFTPEEIWNFETSGERMVASEALVDVNNSKEFGMKHIDSEQKTLLPMNEYVSRRNYSFIRQAQVGLMIDVNRSQFVKLYSNDVWSVPVFDRLVATSPKGAVVSYNVDDSKEICQKRRGFGHTEAFFNKPTFAAIVVKQPLDRMSQRGREFVAELRRLSGLPVIDLTNMKEIERQVRYNDFNFSFSLPSEEEKLTKEILEKLSEEDKYEEFVEDIEEDEED